MLLCHHLAPIPLLAAPSGNIAALCLPLQMFLAYQTIEFSLIFTIAAPNTTT